MTETSSTVYDLGAHTLEVSHDHTILIAAHVTDNAEVKELIQLESDETYKLFMALQLLFQ